jgi:hypothetical protein
MKKLIILPLLFLAFYAQGQHNNAIGLRGGLSRGITFQHYFKKSTALEPIVANRWKGYNFCALLEKHLPIKGAAGLGWYYGAGAIQYFYAQDPQADLRAYQPENHLARVQQVSALMDSTNPDLSAFQARGGKLLLLEMIRTRRSSP